MSDETKILMTVPKDVIDAQVRAAVAQALAKDPAALVKAVVDAAMFAKKNTYDRTTIWEEQINEMIREVAKEQFKAWLQDQKPTIAKAIKEKLGSTAKTLIDRIAGQMAENVAGMYISAHFPDR